jgi:hypothetical protein
MRMNGCKSLIAAAPVAGRSETGNSTKISDCSNPLDTAHGVSGCLGRRPETASHQEQLK